MSKILKNFLWLVLSFLIAFAFVFLLKTFIGMPTTVKGTSMYPTLKSGEKLFLSTWSTNFNKEPKRGDIITFEAPSVDLVTNADKSNPIAIYNEDSRNIFEKILYYGLGISDKSYIKRVIGISGDHIEIKDGSVYVNGSKLVEDYTSGKTDLSLGGEFDDIIVPEGYVYVLGDNRTVSVDSRRFGCIPIDKIEGKVVCRWWPLKRIKTW